MPANNDVLDDLIEQVRTQHVPVYPKDDMIARALQTGNTRGDLTTLPRKRLAIARAYFAAAAILVVTVSTIVWRIGPFSSADSFAFEKVLSAVGQVKSVRYTITTTGWKGNPWPDPYVSKVLVLEPGRVRSENNDHVYVSNAVVGRMIEIEPGKRTATIHPFYPGADGKPATAIFDNFSERLRNIPATATPQSGQHKINGRDSLAFRWKIEDTNYLVYVDAATRLPLRMEADCGEHQGKHIKDVFDEFDFDAPVEESLFEIKIPAGYTVNEYVPDKDNKTYPKADAVDLVVSPGKIGPVKSGMSSDDIGRLLGKPDWMNNREIASPLPAAHPEPRPVEAALREYHYDSRGFQLTIGPIGNLSITCMSQARQGPIVRDFAGRTAEGIRIGALRDEVLKTYGKPEIEQRDSMMYVELGWQFFIRNNKVAGFSTNQPMPKRRADGVQTRVLKDGTILSTAPGVDIDAMIDKDGNVKKEIKAKGTKVK